MTLSDRILAGYFTSITSFSKNYQNFNKSILNDLVNEMAPVPLLELSKTDIAIYVQKLVDRNVADNSIKKYLSAIKQFYEYAYYEDVYPDKEFKRISQYQKKYRPAKGEIKTRLTTDDLIILAKYAKNNRSLRFCIWFILNFGVRISELFNLHLYDIDFENLLVTIRRAKWKKTRRIPIYDSQVQPLKDWLSTRELFLPLKSAATDAATELVILQRTQKPTTHYWLSRILRKFTKQTKDDYGRRIHFYAHRLRRTCACILFFDLAEPIENVSFTLGHESIKTTQEYLGITEKDQIERMRKSMAGKKILSIEI